METDQKRRRFVLTRNHTKDITAKQFKRLANNPTPPGIDKDIQHLLIVQSAIGTESGVQTIRPPYGTRENSWLFILFASTSKPVPRHMHFHLHGLTTRLHLHLHLALSVLGVYEPGYALSDCSPIFAVTFNIPARCIFMNLYVAELAVLTFIRL